MNSSALPIAKLIVFRPGVAFDVLMAQRKVPGVLLSAPLVTVKVASNWRPSRSSSRPQTAAGSTGGSARPLAGPSEGSDELR